MKTMRRCSSWDLYRPVGARNISNPITQGVALGWLVGAPLVLTLIMLGKLEEARQILAANWQLNAPPHANTTPRLAFLRHLIALLESQPARWRAKGPPTSQPRATPWV